MIVRPINPETLSQYIDEKELSLFLQAEWLEVYKGQAELLGVFSKSEAPKAMFAMYKGVKLGASFGITAPLSPHCGLSLLDRSKKLSSSQTFEKNVHDAIAKYLTENGGAVVDINFPTGIKDTQEYGWQDFSVTPRYTYLLNILASADDLKAGMSASKRQNLNKGFKDDLRVELTRDSNLIMSVIKSTFDSKGESFHEDIFMRILNSEGLKSKRFSFITYVNGKPSACVFVVHDNQTAYYLLGGYNRDNSHEGSGTLAMWNAILESKRRGLRSFDFLGSMIPEVERYIRGFGGELTPFFSVSKRSVLANVFMKITGRS